MNNLIRRRVSQNRKRFVEGRYDLDLTYITDNIIAVNLYFIIQYKLFLINL